ncbi:MAG: hypothetical protein DDT25_01158 [Chloroflexi bacterium]|nr:hypothetical protein [Chloroflexota bacterium]
MDIFQFLRDRNSPPSPSDELLYEFVARELANSVVKQGLWTKALSENDWHEPKAKASYVRMRIVQLREELKVELARLQARTSCPVAEALSFGLSEDEVAYLGEPIKAVRYLEKYRTSKEAVSKAIGLGKLRGVLHHDVLWVQDRPIRR